VELTETIARAKQLIAQRDALDAELSALFGGTLTSRRKTPACSLCHQEGHRATSCPSKPTE
jgi:hypothetical protein